eukprot:6026896-Prymnesium_polylepis.1
MWTGFEEGLAGPLNRVPRTSLLALPLASPPRTCAHPDCFICFYTKVTDQHTTHGSRGVHPHR